MNLSQPSERQEPGLRRGWNIKAKEFKCLSPSSSFGLNRDRRKVNEQRLTSHLIYTTSPIHHPWQAKSPSFHSHKGEECLMGRGSLSKKSYFYFVSEGKALRRLAAFHLNYIIYPIFFMNSPMAFEHITMCSFFTHIHPMAAPSTDPAQRCDV